MLMARGLPDLELNAGPTEPGEGVLVVTEKWTEAAFPGKPAMIFAEFGSTHRKVD
jgi:hypothetical protein